MYKRGAFTKWILLSLSTGVQYFTVQTEVNDPSVYDQSYRADQTRYIILYSACPQGRDGYNLQGPFEKHSGDLGALDKNEANKVDYKASIDVRD